MLQQGDLAKNMITKVLKQNLKDFTAIGIVRSTEALK